ncbi:MAG: DNA alkylation repair protein [Rikenellaceae bacterium]|jgi:3-methyladenine DNA glycosylase AlkD
MNIKENIDFQLKTLAEEKYRFFSQKIIPTGYELLGVRMPSLKKLAKELSTDNEIEVYLKNALKSEDQSYEHIILYGLILGELKNISIETVFTYLDPLIYKFDNWAHVDSVVSALKIFKKSPDEAFTHFLPLKEHNGEFTKRFFVIFMMDYLMDATHIDATLKHLSQVRQGQYYVDMGIAWALSNGLVKFYYKTIQYLENRSFSEFVHNKTIQKACDSFRITPVTKELLKSLKI